jgi:hypothetical protein
MYQLVNNSNSIKRLADSAFIPMDEANRDYRDYLAWIDEDNQPLPADPEPVVVPQTVTMAQARIALQQAGLFAVVESVLNNLPEPKRAIALTAWEYAPNVSRNGALVTTLASVVGLTEAQLDALFTTAAAIEL